MPVFRFKEFTVRHDRSGMKVGTDGVLLGAWVRPTPEKPVKRILLELQKGYSGKTGEEEFAIELERHVYTPEYVSLTGEFYLNM